MFRHIAIIGAGPAGSALACFLKERGIRVTVFDDDNKPELLVGESLIPAAMPIIRRLGIEDQVAQISSVKRGAALRHSNGTRVDFEFQKFGSKYPDYAYNIPRPQFDSIVRSRALEMGADFIDQRAKFRVTEENPENQIALSSDTLDLAGINRCDEPDLIIDASGRTRAISRMLKIPAKRGPRNDVAHFAHFENFASDSELDGQVVLSVLKHGWSWQIPLPGKTSVGAVLNAKIADSYGETAEDRLENIIQENAFLANAGKNRRQIGQAMTYANYQLISEKAAGPGWLLVGDALGFVDPMLSPGVFMALESASLADAAIFSRRINSTSDFLTSSELYFNEIQNWHQAWSSLIDYFYDGRILAMGAKRNSIRSASRFSMSKLAEPIVSRALAQMVGGIATRSRFNQQALFHTCRHLINSEDQQAENSIQSGAEHNSLNIAA